MILQSITWDFDPRIFPETFQLRGYVIFPLVLLLFGGSTLLKFIKKKEVSKKEKQQFGLVLVGAIVAAFLLPVLFPEVGPWPIRYYGLLFVAGFLIGLKIMEKMLQKDQVPAEWLDPLFVYMFVATLVGARLGHVFFYDWAYYQNHIGEIFLPFSSGEFTGFTGLASHGAAVGIIFSLWLFSKRVSKKSVLWILDRIVVTVALAGMFIRLGNFANSEIFGVATNLPWGVRFLQSGYADAEIPRHPTQIYEALCYLVSFVILSYMYWLTKAKEKLGLLFGSFLVLIFTARFFIEFVKEDQKAFEADMMLNMGQWLSVPFIIVGLYFMFRKSKENAEA